jgi:ATP-dependent DNA helicase PIF1
METKPQILNDPSQEEIISLIRKGGHIFITGPGGTGKSTIIKKIHSEILNVGITAMTGCAALLLDCKAKTLHSWTGIGLGRDSFEKILEGIQKKRHIKKRWTSTRTLVIDEISMLTPELFELLDGLGRNLRKNPKKLFGGIQLVLVGDFCQLPPVMKDISGDDTRFLFESKLWPEIENYVILNKIWRQTDPIYQKILSEIRFGTISSESETILRTCMNKDWQKEIIRPTLLFSKNYEVDKVNEHNLKAIDSVAHIYKSKKIFDPKRWEDEGFMPEKDSESVLWAFGKLEQDASFVPTLELREGAQVMLNTNYDIESELVNGSRGVIIGFANNGNPIVQFRRGGKHIIEPFTWWSHELPHVGISQIPLRVAYAITIHKSQGASIDSAIIDIGKNTFEYGQAYVALSRVRSLEGLYLHALDVGRIRTHPRVLSFYTMKY